MPNEVKWGISLLAGGALIALGWKVPVLLTVFHVLICFLLIVVVLMQSGKAADLAGAFGGSGSQTAFGPRGAANLLTRVTTWCFIMFLLTSVTLSLRRSGTRPTGSSVLENVSKPAPPPKAPTTTPATPAPGQQPPAQQTPPPAQAPAQQPPAQQQPAPAPAKPPGKP